MTNPFGFPRSAPDPYDPFPSSEDPSFEGDCSTMISRLYHFLDGELTEQRRARIQGHLDNCPSCYSAFDFEAELRIVVANRAQTQVPSHLVDRIRASIVPGTIPFSPPVNPFSPGTSPFPPSTNGPL